ncbi:MFS transporter [Nocardia sp. AB354]|uniref:MFS transporter n=1 Tax=Nocardia sp. AB354 TaxID=3413283 RepID=UPI003C23F3BC
MREVHEEPGAPSEHAAIADGASGNQMPARSHPTAETTKTAGDGAGARAEIKEETAAAEPRPRSEQDAPIAADEGADHGPAQPARPTASDAATAQSGEAVGETSPKLPATATPAGDYHEKPYTPTQNSAEAMVGSSPADEHGAVAKGAGTETSARQHPVVGAEAGSAGVHAEHGSSGAEEHVTPQRDTTAEQSGQETGRTEADGPETPAADQHSISVLDELSAAAADHDSLADAAALPRSDRDKAVDLVLDFNQANADHVPESQRLSNLPDDVLMAGLHSGDEHQSLLATMEIIRRGTISAKVPGGMVLRVEQAEAVYAMKSRPVEMKPGQGKSLVFMAAAMQRAVQHKSVLLVTTTDGLANREVNSYRKLLTGDEEFAGAQKLLGKFGIDVFRADQQTGFGPITEGRPAIVVATGETVGHLCNKGVEPPRHALIDEMDGIIDRGERQFLRSEGVEGPASTETAKEVFDAHDFLMKALGNGTLSHEDFGLVRFAEHIDVYPDGTPEYMFWYDGQPELTPEGRAKVETLSGGTKWLEGMGASRLEAAAQAEFLVRNGVHYRMGAGKIKIIDQAEHSIQHNPKTTSESRWSAEPGKASLAQAVEAKEIRAAETRNESAEQHGIVVRADAESAKRINSVEIYRVGRFFDEVTGASGTLTDLNPVLKKIYGLQEVHEVARSQTHRLVEGQPDLVESTYAKLRTIAEYAGGMRDGGGGRFQMVLCHRDDLVTRQVTALERAGVPREAIESVDAERIIGWGADWEAQLQKVFDEAGEQGKILVINRQGQRGVDISVSDTVKTKGGMHVWMTEAPEQSYIHEQAKNRTARNGQRGSAQVVMSPQDALIRNAMHLRGVREAVIVYEQAVAAHATDPTPQHHEAVVAAQHAVRELVPELQQRSLRHSTADFIRHHASSTYLPALAIAEAETGHYRGNTDFGRPDGPADRTARLAGLLGIPAPVLAGHLAVPERDGAIDPLRELLEQNGIPLAGVEALRQHVDATAPASVLQRALFTDEQALDHLTPLRDRLAVALGVHIADLDGAEGMRTVDPALTDARNILAEALGCPASAITPTIARDILGEAVGDHLTAVNAGQPASRDGIATAAVDSESVDSGSVDSVSVDLDARDPEAETPGSGDRTDADIIAAASQYLATAALLDLVVQIHRRSPNSCVNNAVTGMRVLCPDNARRFEMPATTLRGHGRDVVREVFGAGLEKAESLKQVAETLKSRPGGISVLVYKWKDTRATGSADADDRTVLLVNDSDSIDEPNLVVVDLAVSRDGDTANDYAPKDLRNRRTMLNKAVGFDNWRREQKKFIDRLPMEKRLFETIEFDRDGNLVTRSRTGAPTTEILPPSQQVLVSDATVDEIDAVFASLPDLGGATPVRPGTARSNDPRRDEHSPVGARPSEHAANPPSPNSRKQHPFAVLNCLPWISRIIWALGNDDATANPDPTKRLPAALEKNIRAGLQRDENQRAGDPVRRAAENLIRDPTADTAVIVVGKGTRAHPYVLTDVNGTVYIYDPLIASGRHRMRIFDPDTWEPGYPDPDYAYHATFRNVGGRLVADTTPDRTQEATEHKNQHITGPFDRIRDKLPHPFLGLERAESSIGSTSEKSIPPADPDGVAHAANRHESRAKSSAAPSPTSVPSARHRLTQGAPDPSADETWIATPTHRRHDFGLVTAVDPNEPFRPNARSRETPAPAEAVPGENDSGARTASAADLPDQTASTPTDAPSGRVERKVRFLGLRWRKTAPASPDDQDGGSIRELLLDRRMRATTFGPLANLTGAELMGQMVPLFLARNYGETQAAAYGAAEQVAASAAQLPAGVLADRDALVAIRNSLLWGLVNSTGTTLWILLDGPWLPEVLITASTVEAVAAAVYGAGAARMRNELAGKKRAVANNALTNMLQSFPRLASFALGPEMLSAAPYLPAAANAASYAWTYATRPTSRQDDLPAPEETTKIKSLRERVREISAGAHIVLHHPALLADAVTMGLMNVELGFQRLEIAITVSNGHTSGIQTVAILFATPVGGLLGSWLGARKMFGKFSINTMLTGRLAATAGAASAAALLPDTSQPVPVSLGLAATQVLIGAAATRIGAYRQQNVDNGLQGRVAVINPLVGRGGFAAGQLGTAVLSARLGMDLTGIIAASTFGGIAGWALVRQIAQKVRHRRSDRTRAEIRTCMPWVIDILRQNGLPTLPFDGVKATDFQAATSANLIKLKTTEPHQSADPMKKAVDYLRTKPVGTYAVAIVGDGTNAHAYIITRRTSPETGLTNTYIHDQLTGGEARPYFDWKAHRDYSYNKLEHTYVAYFDPLEDGTLTPHTTPGRSELDDTFDSDITGPPTPNAETPDPEPNPQSWGRRRKKVAPAGHQPTASSQNPPPDSGQAAAKAANSEPDSATTERSPSAPPPILAAEEPGTAAAESEDVAGTETDESEGDGRDDSLVRLIRREPYVGVRIGAELLDNMSSELLAMMTSLYFMENGAAELAGLVAGATNLVYVAGALIGGHLSDHVAPKGLMTGTLAFAAVSDIAATINLESGSTYAVPVLIVTTLVNAGAAVLYTIVADNLLAGMVGNAQLGLNRLNNLKVHTTRVLGNVLAPAALAAGAWPAPLVSLGADIVNLMTVRQLPDSHNKPKSDKEQGILESIAEGARIVKDSPHRIRSMAVIGSTNAYLGLEGLLATSVVTDSGLSIWQQGAALSLIPLGGVAGTFLIPKRWVKEISIETLRTISLAGLGVPAILAATTTNPWETSALFGLTWASLGMAGPPMRTHMNNATPPEFRGRVRSFGTVVNRGAVALTPLVGAALIGLFGNQTASESTAVAFGSLAGWSMYRRLFKAKTNQLPNSEIDAAISNNSERQQDPPRHPLRTPWAVAPLPSSLRRIAKDAARDAAETRTDALRPAAQLGVEIVDRPLAAIARDVDELLRLHKSRDAAVLRGLVVTDATAQVLLREDVPELAERFAAANEHIATASWYAAQVRKALAIVVARTVLEAEGAEPIAEGIGVVSGESRRIVVASPLRNQQHLLDVLKPGYRQQAQRDGIPIEYWHVLVDEEGNRTVEPISGSHPGYDPGIRYYVDEADIAWMHRLLDQRSFVEKRSEAIASGELSRDNIRLKGHFNSAQDVVLVSYRNGFQEIQKTVRQTEHADAEYLVAKTLRAVGLAAPETVRLDELVLAIEFVPGTDAENLGESEVWRRFFDTPSGRRLGKGDFLIQALDRLADVNWRVRERRGDMVPYDNSMSFRNKVPADGFTERVSDGSGSPIVHDIPRAELVADRRRIMALEPEFARLNRLDWFRTVLDNLTLLEQHAQDGAAPAAPGPDAVLAALERRGDRLAEKLNLTYRKTPSQWRAELAYLQETAPHQHEENDIATLAAVVKLHLHAQMRQWSPDDVVRSPAAYLEMLDQRLADLEHEAENRDIGLVYEESRAKSVSRELDFPQKLDDRQEAPEPEVIANCAIHIARVHKALGDDSTPQPVDTDQRWDADDNWRITEETLGTQLRPMKTKGADPIAIAVATIRDPANTIDRAAVAVGNHIHYVVDAGGEILVFDTLVGAIGPRRTAPAQRDLRVRNYDGDKDGNHKWQPSYPDYEEAFCAFFGQRSEGVSAPARDRVSAFRHRKHPPKLLGRPDERNISTPEEWMANRLALRRALHAELVRVGGASAAISDRRSVEIVLTRLLQRRRAGTLTAKQALGIELAEVFLRLDTELNDVGEPFGNRPTTTTVDYAPPPPTAGRLQGVFPPQVHTSFSFDCSTGNSRLNIWRNAVRVLQQAGLGNPLIALDADSKPVWPARLVGDIAQSHGFTIVAVADAAKFSAIGLDVRPDSRQATGPFPTLTRYEHDRLTTLTEQFGHTSWEQVLASAKGNLVRVRTRLDGSAPDGRQINVTLRPDPGGATGRFDARIATADGPVPMSGTFRIDRGVVITGVAVPHADTATTTSRARTVRSAAAPGQSAARQLSSEDLDICGRPEHGSLQSGRPTPWSGRRASDGTPHSAPDRPLDAGTSHPPDAAHSCDRFADAPPRPNSRAPRWCD